MKLSLKYVGNVTIKINLLCRAVAGLFFFLCLGQGICVYAREAVFEKEGEIYLIQSAQDMRTLALLVNNNKEVEPGVPAHSASYLLTRDIDLSAYCTQEAGWTPIGRGREEGEDEIVREFNGSFDGGNHMVTGLYINLPDGEDSGLFGTRSYLPEDRNSAEYQDRGRTVIKNLYIKDCDITGGLNVGGVMGGMPITSGLGNGGELWIENCHVTGKIVGFDSAGGITGAASVVENCSFTGTVKAYSAVGGIAGIAYYIRGCAVHARIEGDIERPLGGDTGGIGGIAVCVRDSYMVGAVTGTDNIGGITGRGPCLTGCYARADVTGDNYTGELLGCPQEFPLDGVFLPEGASKESKIQNCLTGGKDITDFQAFMEGVEEAENTRSEEKDFKNLPEKPEGENRSNVWYCAADCAWPILSWERKSRFGYTVAVTAQEGDSLWKIAGAVYRDGHFWTQIYEENRERIGENAGLLTAGTELEITVNASQADYAAKGDVGEQEKAFLEDGRKQGIAEAQLKRFYSRMLADDLWNGAVWEGEEKQISNWVIDDLDGNGQADMTVMVGSGRGMVPGEVWLYLNEEPAYLLMDESAYYEEGRCFGFGFWYVPEMGDFDNDGNPELAFEVFNGGNGGPGGRDICLFRRVGNEWAECFEELPNDYGEQGDAEVGLRVNVTCIGVNRYEAYCPYLEERIEFDGQNSREIGEDEFGRTGGSNVRGFYGLECVNYQGKNALMCWEYLSGEGGNAHGVGAAAFILVWDKDGVCRVADWRIEGWN